jgi:hypothetical protein
MILFPSPEKQSANGSPKSPPRVLSAGEGLVRQGLRSRAWPIVSAQKSKSPIGPARNQHHELAGRDEITQTALLARQKLPLVENRTADPLPSCWSSRQATAVVN